MLLSSIKPSSICRTVPNTFIWHVLTKKKEFEKLQFLTKTTDYALSKNANFASFSNRCFYSLQRLFNLSRTSLNTFDCLFLNKKNEWQRLQIWEKPWSNPFGKMQTFRLFSNRCFYRLKSLFLYVERHQTLSFATFSLKKSEKNYSFWKKPMDYPFKNMQILWLFKIDVFIV